MKYRRLQIVVAVVAVLCFSSGAFAALYPFNPNAGQRIQGTSGSATDMSFLAHYQVTPATVDLDYIDADISATTAPVTFAAAVYDAQPDIARVITVDPKGTTADVAASNVTVVGTDINGTTITDSLALIANATEPVTSIKAFASIATIAFATMDGTGADFDIGIGKAVGIIHTLREASLVQTGLFDNTDELTNWTVTTHATDVSRNIISINGTLDGAKQIDAWYIVE